MIVSIIDKFRSTGQPICTTDDIARHILGILTANAMNGKAIYVEGSQGWEIEDGLWNTMPMWLGPGANKEVAGGSGFGRYRRGVENQIDQRPFCGYS